MSNYNYDFEADAKAFGDRGFSGDLITKPGTLRTRFPSFEDLTQFRAFPAIAPDGTILPWRKGLQTNQFNPFMMWLPDVVRMAGVPQSGRAISFISRPLSAEGGQTPYDRIIQVVKARMKDPTHGAWWEQLTKGGHGRGASIPYPQNMIGMQGYTLQTNKRDMRGEPRYEMLIMPKTATEAFMTLLHSAGNNPQGTNMEEIFHGGDITHPERGKLINLQDKQKVAAQSAGTQMTFVASTGPQFTSRQPGKSQMEVQQYAVWFEPSPVLSPEMVRSLWRPWDQIIRWLTVQEQVVELCNAFMMHGTPDPAFLVVAFFRDSPQFEQYVPAEIRDRYFRNLGMVGYTGAPVPQAAPQPQTAFPQAPAVAPGYPGAAPGGFAMPVNPAAAPAAAPQAPFSAPGGYPQAPQAPFPGQPQAPAAPPVNPWGTPPATAPAPMPMPLPEPAPAPAPAPQSPAFAPPGAPPQAGPQFLGGAGPVPGNPGIASSANRLAEVMATNQSLMTPPASQPPTAPPQPQRPPG